MLFNPNPVELETQDDSCSEESFSDEGDRDVVEDIIEGGIALEEVEDEDEDEDENENEDTETVYDPLSGWKNDPINPVLPKFIHYSGPNLPFFPSFFFPSFFQTSEKDVVLQKIFNSFHVSEKIICIYPPCSIFWEFSHHIAKNPLS